MLDRQETNRSASVAMDEVRGCFNDMVQMIYGPDGDDGTSAQVDARVLRFMCSCS